MDHVRYSAAHRSASEPVSDPPTCLLYSTGVVQSMSYKSLWSIKLFIVMTAALLTVPLIIIGDDYASVVRMVVLMLFAAQMFYSIAVLWDKLYTDIAVLTVLVLWLVYSSIATEFVLPLGIQLSRDILALVFVFILNIRCCAMARLRDIERTPIQPHWKNFLFMLCYSPNNLSFYVGTEHVLGDAIASPFGVLMFSLSVFTVFFVPVGMLIPCDSNGAWQTPLWIALSKLAVLACMYLFCDKLFTPTDRLERCNASVIVINCLMTLLVHPYLYPMVLSQLVVMLFVTAKLMPGEPDLIMTTRNLD